MLVAIRCLWPAEMRVVPAIMCYACVTAFLPLLSPQASLSSNVEAYSRL